MSEIIEVNKTYLDKMISDFSNKAELTPELLQERRNRILQLESAMTQVPGAVGMAEFNVGKIHHHFATGVYGRELFIPAGNIIVSKIHKGKTFNVIAKGKISVICPTNGFNTYEGPFCFVSNEMTKRVVIAHEDTLWITSHGTDATNLDEVEKEIISKSFEDKNILTTGDELCLG